jgi:hypothetical protein
MNLRYFSPTAICVAHETIHKANPKGKDAARAIHRLHRYFPALWLLPKGNIYIRHHLTLSALYHEAGDSSGYWHHEYLAREAMSKLCSPALPYLEGWSYLNYIRQAYEYWMACGGVSEAWNLTFIAQDELAASMALAGGEVPTTDTRENDRVRPADETFATCPTFTVWRSPGRFLLVHHDARVRKFRFNLHVENTFGRVVQDKPDWNWYTGWPNKRVKLLWRLFPLKMRVLSRGYSGVTLKIGKKVLTIKP